MKEKMLIDIKRRIGIMVESCSAIRTLNGVFAYHSSVKDIVLQLDELRSKWDSDRRPVLQDNSIVNYLDFKKMNLITTTSVIIPLDSLSEQDIFTVYNYFEQMIPRPIREDVRL